MSEHIKKEQELISKIQKGDESAFVEVYHLYWKRLFNFGYKKLAKKEIVEGIVQEVFIDFWTKRQTLDIHSSLTSYLFTAVNYKIINQYKSQVVRENFAQKERKKGEQNDSSTDDKVLFDDLKANLKRVINRLPAQRRQVYQLRHNQGLSNIEIAQTLQISVSTVEKHMIKAMKDIRTGLREFTFSISIMALLSSI
ncbi:RNA polymerase sigma-70 factor [Algoriphagus halophytocola]|uniref:RNA polymerase sigma-70 factor n=1 Tax=Algoriphagus halophytocola TaxID=2991499 RepID=A0ABY6MP83_9BACT|nr:MULTISPECIES: RNA polymerase sigma-70 factor [unclassified Algoriphagus]UZD24202.1 RNA polymerase sigma-70 factor [Algoriphagus sp. TR-M5]WBL41571.1 RNA polymerase sigma-70 factor [Algoriphagus sp. TR-M9]